MKITKTQLKQIIKEELESVMGEAATTDDEHMAEMVYANASEALRHTLRGLEDGSFEFEEAVQSLMDNAVGSGEESASDVAPIVRRLLNGETL
jgi:Arc/MetJ-type ribon-helix-helix transcriptional regulator